MALNKFLDKDLRQGVLFGLLAGAALLSVVLPLRMGERTVALPRPQRSVRNAADFAGERASLDVHQLAQWVVNSADNGTRPFVILDKKDTRVFVFDANGRVLGATPVLLGHAQGDDTVPGIGTRPIEAVRPEERTTPAGRFVSVPGRNTLGENVLWVDYDAAVSIHRVRLSTPSEQRVERLASPTADDNRISYGCINMPVPFFEQVLWPHLRRGSGAVYVLPEQKSIEQAFPGVAAFAAAAAVGG